MNSLPPRWQQQGQRHSWTYLFSGYSDRGNRMAICRSRLLLLPDLRFLSLDSDLFCLQQWGLLTVHVNKAG